MSEDVIVLQFIKPSSLIDVVVWFIVPVSDIFPETVRFVALVKFVHIIIYINIIL